MKNSLLGLITCLSIISLTATLTGCDNDSYPIKKGSVVIHFDNRVGAEELVLGNDYVNLSEETFKVTKLNYYISNIALRQSDGKTYTVPQDSSYFLVLEGDEESQSMRINNIPEGDYSKITFTIGVDSLRSTMDISRRTGVLDPAQGHDGMYWVWNSGYIFFKMEGTSPSAPIEQENKFYYHIGGFGGFDSPTVNNIRKTTLDLGSDRIEIRQETCPEVVVNVDVLEFLKIQRRSGSQNIRW